MVLPAVQSIASFEEGPLSPDIKNPEMHPGSDYSSPQSIEKPTTEEAPVTEIFETSVPKPGEVVDKASEQKKTTTQIQSDDKVTTIADAEEDTFIKSQETAHEQHS
jgi:hypothetical protein